MRPSCVENDYDSKNHLPTATARNYVIDSSSINLCITDGENQTLSPASKHFLEWHFRFGHHNLHETHLIIWSPPFGTDKFLSSSCIPFGQFPKCEVCQYEKAKRKALHGKKTHIYVSHEGPLCNNNPPHGFGVSVDNFVPH